MGCPARNRNHRNLAHCTMELQQSATEESLLICCKAPGGSREAIPAGQDLLSKIMGLEFPAPTGTTGTREICC
jgi:hypothetical protein